MPNFTPSVQRVAPAGLKTSKSASEYIKYRRLALRNAAGNYLPVQIVDFSSLNRFKASTKLIDFSKF